MKHIIFAIFFALLGGTHNVLADNASPYTVSVGNNNTPVQLSLDQWGNIIKPRLLFVNGTAPAGYQYRLKVALDEAGSNVIGEALLTTAPWRAEDINLKSDVRYFWSVEALNANVSETQSSYRHFVISMQGNNAGRDITFLTGHQTLPISQSELIIKWKNKLPYKGATLDLYANDQLIVEGINLDAYSDQYTWQLYNLDAGNYQIKGVMHEGDTLTEFDCCTVKKASANSSLSVVFNNGQNTNEDGSQLISVSIALNAPLASGKTYQIEWQSNDVSEGVLTDAHGKPVASTTMRFTSANWSAAKNLYVRGVSDCELDGPTFFSVVPSGVTTTDTNYQSLQVQPIVFNNLEHSKAGSQPFICGYDVLSSNTDNATQTQHLVKAKLLNPNQVSVGAVASVSAVTNGVTVVGNQQQAFGDVQPNALLTSQDTLTVTMPAGSELTSLAINWDVTIEDSAVLQEGSQDDDVIIGSDENDIVTASEGNDSINTGSGDDVIATGSGSNTIDAGSGNDTITIDTSAQVASSLDGGTGTDTLTGTDGDDTWHFSEIKNVEIINGGSGTNVIAGTNNGDVLDFTDASLQNIKHIDGQGGNDTITGGSNDDELRGNTGDDTLNGGQGNDLLLGGEGQDTLLGGTGSDQLNGGTGNDVLKGGDGNDTLNGGDNNDALNGGSGNDQLNGDNGNDQLAGGLGSDTLNGGSGDDVLAGDEGNDTLNGGDGSDVLAGGVGTDTLQGGAGNDALAGDAGADSLQGGAGNDVLSGGSDADNLNGGEGNDTLNGGTQNDTLIGGLGSDTYQFAHGDGSDVITETFAVADLDVIEFTDSTNFSEWTFALDYLDLKITSTHNQEGQPESQTITISNWLTEHKTQFAARLSNGTEQNISELIDTSHLHVGTVGNNQLSGSPLADLFLGLEGNDTLIGKQGNDELLGGAGDDTLYGYDASGFGDANFAGDDQDTLEGGLGNDTLSGGYGNDTYIFNAGDGQDTIKDARIASDVNFVANFTSQGTETLKFSAGISASDLAFSFDGSDLIVAINSNNNNSDQIRIQHWLESKEQDGQHYRNSSRFNVMWSDGFVQSLTSLVALDSPEYQHAGSESSDTLLGYAGDETINGLGGDDTLYGDAGSDTLNGGIGSDTLYGGADNDNLNGDLGNDILFGGTGNDVLNGGEGNDTLQGDMGDDVLSGGAGNDSLQGNLGDDVLSGGAGDDSLQGNSGNDALSGGEGNDSLQGDSGDDALN
ncbi:MAG: calcium-binding protein, partial [Bermanella sp.]